MTHIEECELFGTAERKPVIEILEYQRQLQVDMAYLNSDRFEKSIERYVTLLAALSLLR
jgi:hypothetical protein